VKSFKALLNIKTPILMDLKLRQKPLKKNGGKQGFPPKSIRRKKTPNLGWGFLVLKLLV
jgi:hypothetical protein